MCYRKILLHKKRLFILLLLALVAIYEFRNVYLTSYDVLRYLQQVNVDWSNTIIRFKNYTNYFNSLPTEAKLSKKQYSQVQCKEPPFLLVLVHSKPSNFRRRQAIRYSWASQSGLEGPHIKRSYRIVFLLGHSSGPKLQHMLQIESNKSGDLVMGAFIDSYKNLYKKMLLSITWSLSNCPAKYILKTDDDCFVNIDILLSYLMNYGSLHGSKPLYTGRQTASEIERNPKKHHYVPMEIYPSRKKYPPYIAGGGYLFSGSLLNKLYKASQRNPLFAVEDACFGSLMRNIGVKPTDNLSFMPFLYCYIDVMQDVLERPMCEFLGPIVMHGLSPLEMINMYYNIKLMTSSPSICMGNENAWLKSREKCG